MKYVFEGRFLVSVIFLLALSKEVPEPPTKGEISVISNLSGTVPRPVLNSNKSTNSSSCPNLPRIIMTSFKKFYKAFYKFRVSRKMIYYIIVIPD